MASRTQRTTTSVDVTSDQATAPDVLSAWVSDATTRSLQLVEDLDDAQLIGPKLATTNPFLWEIGHAAWFQDHWVVQHSAGQKAIMAGGERLFDSIGIEHDIRWDLPIPAREQVFHYVRQVRDAVLELLDKGTLSEKLTYFVKLSVFHQDMHTEAFTYTRQTLAYPKPMFADDHSDSSGDSCDGGVFGDVELAGGVLQLGAARDATFVFDNEKWSHAVSVEPFSISRTAVNQQEFAAFVDDDGYARRDLWSEEGWRWRVTNNAGHPVYWKRNADSWLWRHFDHWRPLEPTFPMIHVNWFEADAFCRWSGRRLPTESEWEFAAAADQTGKRHYSWGESPPDSSHANLDWQAMGPVDTGQHAAGDTPSGCRQLIGNVWEWTATIFNPYPGFTVDPYEEYSRPCFGNCNVLRGGSWATRSRMIRNTWRNYYPPHRRDVLAGFRTCAAKT